MDYWVPCDPLPKAQTWSSVLLSKGARGLGKAMGFSEGKKYHQCLNIWLGIWAFIKMFQVRVSAA